MILNAYVRIFPTLLVTEFPQKPNHATIKNIIYPLKTSSSYSLAAYKLIDFWKWKKPVTVKFLADRPFLESLVLFCYSS